jgi:hypothetical protein
MGDTPSNYNEANLRFHTLNSKNKEGLDQLSEANEEDDKYENPEFDDGTKLKRKKKGKKKKST